MRTFVTALIVASVVAMAYTARMRAAENAIVPAGAKLERLYTRTADIAGGLTEGPAVAPDGSIYFTDIPDGTDRGLIVRYDPQSGQSTVFADDSGKANGLAFDAAGHLIACEGNDYGGRRVSQWNTKTGQRETLADRFEGKRFNAPNDLCLDSQGRIYFTDPRYLGDEPRELEHRAVYRIEPGGTVREITHDVEKPNGIALSPDEKTLYVADHNNGTDKIDPTAPPPKLGAMTIEAFPLDADGLVNGPKKTIVDYGDTPGCDGMCVDVGGNLYLTNRSPRRPGVAVVTPAGKEIAFIATGPTNQPAGKPPVGLPSNCEFGLGNETATLYVTIDKSLYRIPLKVAGYNVNHKQ